MDQETFISKQDIWELINNKLNELKKDRGPGSMYEIVQRMREVYTIIQGKSNYYQKSNYWDEKFNYDKTNYKRIKTVRNNAPIFNATNKMKNLIEEFLSRFMDITQTDYTIYYKDTEGHTYRTLLTANQADQFFSRLQNTNRSRIVKFTEDALQFLKDTNTTILLDEHFNQYVEDTEKIIQEYKFSRISLGHKSESFERHWSSRHNSLSNDDIELKMDWTKQEILDNLRASLGKDPWWSGGDRGQHQVKFLSFAKTNSIKLGSTRSIEELMNFIFYLSENTFGTPEEQHNLVDILSNTFINEGNINYYINKTKDGLYESLVNYSK